MKSNSEPKRNRPLADEFLFLGNHLALDFLNTHPVLNGEPIEKLTDFKAVLRWFQAASLLSSQEAWKLLQGWEKSIRARRVADAMRELREKLRQAVIAWERGIAVHRSTLDELNQLMAEHPMRTRLSAAGNQVVTELYFEPLQPEDLISPLAYSAATLFAAVDRRRVRKCDQCAVHFYDTSKKGTRRWCSMQLCGNRQKVAAYADRQRLGHPRTRRP